MGSDFYRDCTPQPSHCGFSFIFGHRVSFFSGFPHLPVNGRSIGVLVFSKKEMNTCPSTSPSSTNFIIMCRGIVTLCLVNLIFTELHGSMALYF